MDPEAERILRHYLTEDQAIKALIVGLEEKRKHGRRRIETILRENNADVWPQPKEAAELGIRVKLLKNKPRRSMKYSALESDYEDIYAQLVDEGYLKISPPRTPYRLDIRKVKPKKKK